MILILNGKFRFLELIADMGKHNTLHYNAKLMKFNRYLCELLKQIDLRKSSFCGILRNTGDFHYNLHSRTFNHATIYRRQADHNMAYP